MVHILTNKRYIYKKDCNIKDNSKNLILGKKVFPELLQNQCTPNGIFNAFISAKDNKDKLVNILGRHVFSKKITSSDIDSEIKLKAINGEEVTIKKVNGIVYINEAEVVTADIVVSNGVIHFINRVLQPLN